MMVYSINLIKPVTRKCFSYFLNSPHKTSSFSELIKLTKSGPTNVKNSLDDLKENNLLTSQKIGNKILYKLNLDNYFVRHLLLAFAWEKINKFPENVQNCLKSLYNKFLKEDVDSIYLFGSAIYKQKPGDIDLAVISNENKNLEKIWLETIEDFAEEIECHFFEKKNYFQEFNQGNYKITSTLTPCLVLYDKNFIFNHLGNIPLPKKEFLAEEIKKLENKIKKCFELYRIKKHKECSDILKDSLNKFLRLYIGSKQEIPLSKHLLKRQAKKLGLSIKKRGLWQELEWMDKIIKKIKRNT